MINVYKLDTLRYTPFDKNFIPEDFFYLSKKLNFVDKPNKADIIITSSEKHILKNLKLLFLKKKFLIWTNEPRFSTKDSNFRLFGLFSLIYVMNVHTKSVFVNQVTYQAKRFYGKKILKLSNASHKKNKSVALMSYYNGGSNSALYIKSKNIDLVKTRSQIALYGHQNGFMDIFGRGWPSGISKEDSRYKNWGERKREILTHYRYNLCFENTIAEDYITEKIWDSIENYCLPIYYGGDDNSIYKIFPKGSFVDYTEFTGPKDLFSYIGNMKEEEFNARLQKCISVYNSFIEKPKSFWEDIKQQQLDLIINTCKSIVSNQ